MRKFFKILLSVVLFLLLLVVVFYFWGSSGNIDQSNLNRAIIFKAPPAPAKDTLTVMTYNIGYLSGMTNNLPVVHDQKLYQKNLRKAEKMLDSLPLDLIGFQEIDYGSARSFYVNQLDSLAVKAGFGFGVAATNWDKHYVPFPYWPPAVHFGEMHSGQAVLSRYPIIASERVAMDKPESAPFFYNAFYLDRLIQIVQVDIGRENPLIVLNVHLEAFDEETREKQAYKVLEVYRQYAVDYPVLLIGDFNIRPPYSTEKISDEKTIQVFLDEEGLKPAIERAEYLADERANFTFDTGNPYEKLDYIFYNTDKIAEVESLVVHNGGQISDHFPVMMRFTFVE